MTRYEYLKNASIEEMAEVLCNIVDNVDAEAKCVCDGCPASKKCGKGNGFIHWLKQDAEFCVNAKCLKVFD